MSHVYVMRMRLYGFICVMCLRCICYMYVDTLQHTATHCNSVTIAPPGFSHLRHLFCVCVLEYVSCMHYVHALMHVFSVHVCTWYVYRSCLCDVCVSSVCVACIMCMC